ncbi:MAG TPA: helix-turn-helix domain-containing protein [Candidatus Saccharicenans sp.]|jgi:excisionase family DNA binding protein|nr:helix-turn-helix domain-containing protein [Candidatus Saccharicenans sp.]HOE13938.1 helix-turn-helix domain-containing protein [Candidatus Saccharicenans sp.]HOJ27024.1 helix-turn-helix domain-containing protein [Candidatus Saccharicenans sp.]HOM94946.1 helix-turn-helix domain-containing protein [Candidatus Saccharicenans sp.]HOT69511.1 helix-turn-helix domain-containing protein [Candidatus Saccharicenans sp.]
MEKNEFMTIPQLARLLGLSRIAVYNKVKSGEIKAVRIGRTYAINTKDIADILGKTLTKKSKEEIDQAIKKTIDEYGEVLRLLGQE